MTDQEVQAQPADEPPGVPEIRPALTIHIHSWATPIVGFLMLLIGLAVGFYVYPIVEDRVGAGPAAVTPAPASIDTTPQAEAAGPNPTEQASLMEFVVKQTTHFIGDPNAPVTIVEMSDFQ